MSKALMEKIMRARERGVEVAGHKYTIRRPTDEDVVGNMRAATGIDFVKRFVVGWDLCEIDLIPGGSAEPIPFDAGLWAMYVADHPELWDSLAGAIQSAYEDHVKAREEAAKN